MASQRWSSDGAAQQVGNGVAGGAATGAWQGRASAVERRARGYGVSIHVDRSNKAIFDGDDVFAWKESTMGHCYFISL